MCAYNVQPSSVIHPSFINHPFSQRSFGRSDEPLSPHPHTASPSLHHRRSHSAMLIPSDHPLIDSILPCPTATLSATTTSMTSLPSCCSTSSPSSSSSCTPFNPVRPSSPTPHQPPAFTASSDESAAPSTSVIAGPCTASSPAPCPRCCDFDVEYAKAEGRAQLAAAALTIRRLQLSRGRALITHQRQSPESAIQPTAPTAGVPILLHSLTQPFSSFSSSPCGRCAAERLRSALQSSGDVAGPLNSAAILDQRRISTLTSSCSPMLISISPSPPPPVRAERGCCAQGSALSRAV